MSNLRTYSENSTLAQASYSDLSNGLIDSAGIDVLRDSSEMALAQAEKFAEEWKVVDSLNELNGLSATVFESIETGERRLAIRGTELTDIADLVTDIRDIMLVGSSKLQFQYSSLKSQVTEWLGEGVLSPGFDIAGHSLGGFLAGALSVELSDQVGHAYLYNAPGVGGLGAHIRVLLGLQSDPTIAGPNISNLIADAGTSAVAGLGQDWGAPTFIKIEDQSPNILKNHSITLLSDSLAVQDVLGRLSADLSLSSASSIISAADIEEEPLLESLVNDIGDLFGAGETIEGSNNREALHDRLNAIRDSESYRSIVDAGNGQLLPLVELASSAIAEQAKEGVAYRYALVKLNSFVLLGNDHLFSAHNNSGELDPDNFAETYWDDRAEMLSGWLERNATQATLKGAERKEFFDLESGIFFHIDSTNSNAARQYVFGSEGSDSIEGLREDDRLYGRGGDDTINGGNGDDLLVGGDGSDGLNGGKGFDTYYADAEDTITDSDQRGEVRLDDQILIGGSRQKSDPTDTYYSSDGRYTYRLQGDTLTVNDGLTIEQFSKGDLGIHLNEEVPTPVPVPVPTPPVPVPTPVPTPASPLILDLDGDGIETVGHDADIHFDHGGDSFRELSGFVAPDDALLALDLNGNGIIDNGRELFGNSTLLSNGSAAANGFEALRELDSNGDGIIDANDELFSELRLFQDLDQDGQTDEGELRSLEEASIEQLFLDYSQQNFVDAFGNAHRQVGQYTNSQGQTLSMTDVWFDTNVTDTIGEEVEVAPDILRLPNARGFGRVHSLHQAMARDDSGTLQSLVEDFTAAATRDQRVVLLEKIIFEWTGQSGDYRPHFGANVDARKVGAIGEFLGMPIDNPRGSGFHYARLYRAKFDGLVDTVFFQMAADGHLKDIFREISWAEQPSGVWHGDFSAALPALFDTARANPETAVDLMQDFKQAIRGVNVKEPVNTVLLREQFEEWVSDPSSSVDLSDPLDAMLFGVFSNVTDQRDNVRGSDGDDTLYGLGGSDTIYASGGNDIVIGGKGNDDVTGGRGSDTYHFGVGDGRDRVFNNDDGAGSVDVVKITGGLTSNDVSFYREGDDLVIQIDGTEDAIRVSSHFDGEGTKHHHIDAIVFEDGTRIDVGPDMFDQINVRSQNITELDDELHGTSGDDVLDGLGGDDRLYGKTGSDTLHGSDGNDEIKGDSGNDTLIGGDDEDDLFGGDDDDSLFGDNGHDRLDGESGNDSLTGGLGDDVLIGGGGNDTYHYNRGDGLDRIENSGHEGDHDIVTFGAGIQSGDVRVRRSGNDLLIVLQPAVDEIVVADFFKNSASQIDAVVFSDPESPTVQWSRTELETLALTGSMDVDELHGTEGADIIDGLAGDDNLIGNEGDDQLSGGEGDDVITGGEGADLIDGGIGNDRLKGDAGDDQLYGGDGDDAIWGGDGADQVFGGAGKDSLIGGHEADRLHGDEGDDWLEGGEGADELHGGAGNDHLQGGKGGDTYLFNLGDGIDSIWETGEPGRQPNEIDRLVFGEGITAGDIELEREWGELSIRIKGSEHDRVRIREFFSLTDGQSKIQAFEFADGTTWQLADVISQLPGGTEGRDYLRGVDEHDDWLEGRAGQDKLWGYSGDDVLIGGLDSDELDGGAGDDTYVFRLGDGRDTITAVAADAGHDRILFGPGIKPEDITFSRPDTADKYLVDRDKLFIDFKTSPNDRIQIDKFFDLAEGKPAVSSLVFEDGTTWNLTDVVAQTFQPSDGDDKLFGLDGGDDIRGEAGNDRLFGGEGADVYRFGSSDGVDTVADEDDGSVTNTLFFDTGVIPQEVSVHIDQSGRLLIAYDNGQSLIETDARISAGAFNSQFSLFDVRFASGEVWTPEDLLAKAEPLIGEADAKVGTAGDDWFVVDHAGDSITGDLSGEDTIETTVDYVLPEGVENLSRKGFLRNGLLLGNSADNRIVGGLLNDTLDGGGGQDFLAGGDGDDIYRWSADQAGSEIIELADGGTDRVVINLKGIWNLDGTLSEMANDFHQHWSGNQVESFVLPDNVENMTVVTSSFSRDVDIHGNSMDNVIFYGEAVVGQDGDIWLASNAYSDNLVLMGHDGDDTLISANRNARGTTVTLDGGAGNDRLIGGASDDVYRIRLGDGHDEIDAGGGNNPEDIDILELHNIDLSDMTGLLEWDVPADQPWTAHNDLLIHIGGDSQSIRIDRAHMPDVVRFISTTSSYELSGQAVKDWLLETGNRNPIQIGDVRNQSVDEDQLFSFSLPDDAFRDFDEGDAVALSVRQSDGSPLPSWLTFNPATRMITGTAGQEDVGALRLELVATDSHGAETATGFQIWVNEQNDSPTVSAPIESQAIAEDSLFELTLPENLFEDEEGDSLTIEARLADGGALPEWLSFDGQTFSGTPDNDAVGQWQIEIVATESATESPDPLGDYVIVEGDTGGSPANSVSTTLNLSVVNTNDAPEATGSISDLALVEGSTVEYQLPPGLFVDPDADDSLTLSATMVDGSPLPDWLNFDPANGRFTGTANSVGSLAIIVFATDAAGAQGSVSLTVDVESAATSEYDQVFEASVSGGQLVASAGKDLVLGLSGDDVLFGMSGDDRLNGGSGADQLYGGNGSGSGSGNDTLIGGDGNDTLVGEDGDDSLAGGAGNDSYYYKEGQGIDVIDNTGGGSDGIFFLDGLDRGRLTYHEDGDDLVILVDGDLQQQVRVTDHFLGGDYAISYIQPTDGGFAIMASQLPGMLSAMPSEGGSTGGETGGGSESGGTSGGGDTGSTDPGAVPTPGLGGDDLITGTSVNDILIGGVGNDTLDGGLGNDHLEGGTGDDIYVFTGGQDVLKETEGADTLRFGAGITFNEVASGLMKSGNDLVLRVNGGPDQVTLSDFFLGGASVVETIVFETGGQISSGQIFGAFGMSEPSPAPDSFQVIEGTSGDDANLNGSASADLLQAFGGDDVLSGAAGDDVLEGGSGHDMLIGGLGDDTLVGGHGNDIYVFNSGGGRDVIDNVGGGNDTLRFEDISFNQVASGLMKSGNDLVLRVGGSADSVTIQDFFSGGDQAIDQIEFGPGGQISSAQIFGAFGLSNPDPQGSPNYEGLPDQRGFGNKVTGTASAENILASSDADFIDAGAGNDTITGGRGNDYLIGGEGSDVYRFSGGDGQDTINNLSIGVGDDQLHFGSGIEESQLWFSREGNDLVTTVLGSEDQVRVVGWYGDDAQKLNSIHTDEASITATQLEQLVSAMASFGSPAAGEVALTPQEASQIQATIAGSWQPS